VQKLLTVRAIGLAQFLFQNVGMQQNRIEWIVYFMGDQTGELRKQQQSSFGVVCRWL
jgi:hypothetical protein